MNDRMQFELILDRYHNPLFRGRLKEPKISSQDSNPLCGDELHVDIRIENGIIKDCKFDGRGCSISMASADILLEYIKGKRVEDVLKMEKDDLLKLIGIELGPVRIKCALLSLKVVKKAILEYYRSAFNNSI